jgi:hypothetical protein
MTRCRSTFRKGDVRKAVEAVAKATGAPVQRVEIDREGRVIVVIGNPAGTTETVSEWDAKYGKA